ncbi:MAG TPA: Flp family type IVb pilin [Bryobacteraceae bacterium]
MSIALLQQFWQAEDGQDMIEYSLLLALIALVAITIMSQMAPDIKSIWQGISKQVNAGASAAAG